METVTFKSRPLLTFHHDVSPVRFDKEGLFVTSDKALIEMLRKNTDEVVELSTEEVKELGKKQKTDKEPSVDVEEDSTKEEVTLGDIGVPATSIPKLVEAGVTVEQLAGKTKEELKAIDGIGEKTAETILSYFAKN